MELQYLCHTVLSRKIELHVWYSQGLGFWIRDQCNSKTLYTCRVGVETCPVDCHISQTVNRWLDWLFQTHSQVETHRRLILIPMWYYQLQVKWLKWHQTLHRKAKRSDLHVSKLALVFQYYPEVTWYIFYLWWVMVQHLLVKVREGASFD